MRRRVHDLIGAARRGRAAAQSWRAGSARNAPTTAPACSRSRCPADAGAALRCRLVEREEPVKAEEIAALRSPCAASKATTGSGASGSACRESRLPRRWGRARRRLTAETVFAIRRAAEESATDRLSPVAPWPAACSRDPASSRHISPHPASHFISPYLTHPADPLRRRRIPLDPAESHLSRESRLIPAYLAFPPYLSRRAPGEGGPRRRQVRSGAARA